MAHAAQTGRSRAGHRARPRRTASRSRTRKTTADRAFFLRCAEPSRGGERWARPAAERSGVAGRASACIARSGPLFSFPWARSLAVFLLHPLSRLFSEATCFSFRLDCVPARFSGALGRRACDKLGCRRRRSGEPCSQAGPSFAAVTSRASLSVPALPTTSVHSSRFGTMTYWERGPWCRRARLSRDG